MTTSNSTDYSQSRDNLISTALQILGRLGEGETATTNALTFGANILNQMVKHWEAQGVHLFNETEGTVFLQDGINTYTLVNSASGDHGSNTVVETALSAGASSGATTITVDSITGITASDKIGIELDDGTRQWTTVSGSPSGSTVTLAVALTGDAAENNTVFTYTTKIDRPLAIQSIRVRTGTSDSALDRALTHLGRREYMDMPSKSIEASTVTAYYYSPQLNNGILYVWPTPDNCEIRLKITYLRKLEDFDSGSDTPDFPQEWYNALTLNLAVKLASAYGINLEKINRQLLVDASQSLEELKLWDSEESSVRIIPNNRY